MTERFYSIKHLSTAQLQELYATYIKRGWKDAEFHDLFFEDVTPPQITDEEIILNIQAGRDTNYCVYMIGVEGEEDGIMFGFGMNYNQRYDYSVYLHLPLGLLDELIEKYQLAEISPVKNYDSIEDYIIDDLLNGPMN
ncbi:hypothetical protein GGR21_001306 [Dysgonomonas hofstadii]|uniref:Uncharacterized protein n=1 Tax=Dysgonomonas hofstadii TaxID=637886 RepID=A0A840CUK3_9BACT|nr:hypothetical protein [Dysgonomonas hofstadii]MBB4035413.1 hypothetical protein [Dysgonomonas hofstadii]